MKTFTNNWNLKLTALVLAVALWSHVKSQDNPLVTATFKVNLHFDRADLPKKMIITDSSKIPQFVTVTLYGPRLTLRDYQGPELPEALQLPGETANPVSRELKASLDFSDVKRGEQNLPVRVDAQSSDVQVIAYKPSDVVVTLDQAAAAPFTVEPQFSPALLSTFNISHAIAQPATVEVSGPSDELNRVAHVRARIRGIKSVSGSVQFAKVTLVATTTDGDIVNNVLIEPDTATVTAVVHEIRESKSVPLKARGVGYPASGFQLEKLELMPDHLTVVGPPRTLNSIASISLPIDIQDANATFSRRVDVPLPSDVTAQKGATVTVRALIGRVPAQAEPPQVDDGGGAQTRGNALTLPPPAAN